MDEFYLNVLSSESDVVVLTETWLQENVESSEYFSGNYDVFRFNGGYSGRGRGVLIAVNSIYSSKNLNLTSPVSC